MRLGRARLNHGAQRLLYVQTILMDEKPLDRIGDHLDVPPPHAGHSALALAQDPGLDPLRTPHHLQAIAPGTIAMVAPTPS